MAIFVSIGILNFISFKTIIFIVDINASKTNRKCSFIMYRFNINLILVSNKSEKIEPSKVLS